MATNLSIPQSRVEYYRGFDARVAEVFKGADVDLAAMTRHERRGYDAACRAEAEAEVDGWLARQRDQAAKYDEVASAQDSRSAAGYGWL